MLSKTTLEQSLFGCNLGLILSIGLKKVCTPYMIAGKFGKPIRREQATIICDRLKFARVLVEVNVDQQFPDEVKFRSEVNVVVGVKV